MYKIFIVEDDFTMAEVMKRQIESWGHSVHLAEQFSDILPEFTEYDPHMVLLDIMLPFFNGYHWCSEIRKISNVPVIFISSASDNMNIVMAMNMGGDEYIEKPFDLNVLTAKIQAILRRAYGLAPKPDKCSYKDITLDINSTNLCGKDEEISLTKNEYLILKILIENNNKVVSREEIMDALWGNDEFVDDNTLTVNMTRLRKKLGEIGCDDYIKTKKGLGYILE